MSSELKVSDSEKAIESDRIHAEIEKGLRDSLLAARIEVEALQLAKQDLETKKAKAESGFVWRTTEMARKWVSSLLGKFPAPAKDRTKGDSLSSSGSDRSESFGPVGQ